MTAPPLDLPRLVMRRAAAVGAAVLALALVLGLARMGDDIEEELDAAMALAGVMAQLAQLGRADDAGAMATLQAIQRDERLRHLVLEVRAADGQALLAPPAPEPAAWPLRGLLALHRDWLSDPDSRRVAWTLPRPDGSAWTVSLTASPDSERREAMGSLLDMLGLLLACVGGLLLVMRWNVRRAFAPLGRLLEAIARIEGHDAQAVQALPPMPIRELEALAAALRHLGGALAEADARRRLLSQQVLTLQEDERARLARELHDEFGQHLTALRVDAAWLARQVSGQPALAEVVDGMARHCQLVQQDVRALLGRLQPFGSLQDGDDRENLARGLGLLQALVDSWQRSGRDTGPACRLALVWTDVAGAPLPAPGADAAQQLCLPRPLWLTLYRISQEALTNAARHAQAAEVTLRLGFVGTPQAGAALQIDWQVTDDGLGLPDAAAVMGRGNGLAGLQERVWAQGGQLHWAPCTPGAARPGLRLSARFDTRWAGPGPAPTPP